ncbi:MAG: site-2 protease family protein [bacterium]|nr:site-2 protease family protein [bacterium]MDI1337728.1 site-2 protease family protein [Lacunisphaera sp.]
MTPTRQGSFRLFKFKGIAVHVHWSWFFVAIYSVSIRVPNYASPAWALAEYLALFLVVLLHEFGHALACRQVGGAADQIVLWPLGGVAYVAPPPRPGATLWSITAGPLVNVVLLPVFYGLFYAAGAAGAFEQNPDLFRFLRALIIMDVSLLVFNLLPIYPLDGGQILRSLLWYPLGRARSLLAATGIGFVGGLAIVGLAVWWRSVWIGIMAFYLLANCWQSFQQAKAMRQLEKLPRRPEFKCPVCHASPPVGRYWRCPACGQNFDPFATAAQCPHCQATLDLTPCPDCGNARTQRSWDASIRDA